MADYHSTQEEALGALQPSRVVFDVQHQAARFDPGVFVRALPRRSGPQEQNALLDAVHQVCNRNKDWKHHSTFGGEVSKSAPSITYATYDDKNLCPVKTVETKRKVSPKGADTEGALGTSSAAKEVEKRFLPCGDVCTGKMLIVEPLEVVQLGMREAYDRRMGPGACRRKAEHRESSADRNRHRRSIESEVGRGKTRMTDEGLE